MIQLHLGDCLDVMAGMEENSFGSIVTDPPYGLSFMGRGWDHGVPGVEFWQAALRVAKPGAMLLAFGGTRTHHRLMVAIEDAGWEIRDCLMWLHSQGFPKNKNNLKPAWEPIIMARKPLSEPTVAANVLKWGTGGINIDACRIETADNLNGGAYARNGTHRDDGWGMQRGGAGEYVEPQGRWPANLILDEKAGALLDEQSGELKSGGGIKARKDSTDTNNVFGKNTRRRDSIGPQGFGTDKGGASRFFYCAKASKKDRGEGNNHPTVKPTSLMQWLCRLVTPVGGTILDPFMGSGSTGKAAQIEGFDFVGIDKEQVSFDIATQRLSV